MPKHVLHGEKSRAAIMRGVDLLADAVKVTLGPGGRNVVISRRAINQSPQVTKDGVTVANTIDPIDPTEQIGSDLIREAAQKTVEAAGDGTTTSTLLAQSMCKAGIKMLSSGVSATSLRRGMDKTVAALEQSLRRMSIPIERDMIFDVANISSNGDAEIARIVADAIKEVGKDGIITVEESASLDTHLDVVSGLQLPAGFLSIHFITDRDRIECTYNDPYILLFEGKLTTAKSLIPLLKQVSAAHRPLLVIAGDYEQEAIATFVTNVVRGQAPLCAVKMPAYGVRRREVLRDIAALTGARAITEDTGTKIESVQLADLGQASRFIVTEYKTTIVDGVSTEEILSARVAEIRKQIEAVEGVEKLHLQQRLAGLIGGIAVIKVGAVTSTDMREKKDRVEDAMYATKAAAEEGIVPGGGLALARAAFQTKNVLVGDEALGATIVLDSCLEPLKQIAKNSGLNGELVYERILSKSFKLGYNARADKYEDMVTAGVIDPTKVVTEALKNAASVAGTILTCEAMVTDAEVKTNE